MFCCYYANTSSGGEASELFDQKKKSFRSQVSWGSFSQPCGTSLNYQPPLLECCSDWMMSPAQRNSDDIVRLYKRWSFKQWRLNIAVCCGRFGGSRFLQHLPVRWPLLCGNQPPLQHDPRSSRYLQLAAVTKAAPWDETSWVRWWHHFKRLLLCHMELHLVGFVFISLFYCLSGI